MCRSKSAKKIASVCLAGVVMLFTVSCGGDIADRNLIIEEEEIGRAHV